MTDVQVALAQETIKYGETEYIITPPDYNTRRDYTSYLDKADIEGMIRDRKSWGLEYREARTDLAHRLYTLKVHKWGGQLWKDSLNSDENCEYLCFLVLRQSHATMTEKLCHEICQAPYDGEVIGIDADGNEVEIEKPTIGQKIFKVIAGFINRPN